MPEGMFRSRTKEYLPTLPGRAFAGLMLAVFFTQTCALVDMDLMNGLRGPFWWVLSKSTGFGLMVALALMATRNQKRFLSKAALAIAVILVSVFPRIDSRLVQNMALSGAQRDIQQRVAMDGTCRSSH
jgi:hypothetical protein